jgi:CheY-like chemotaxis protein
VKEEYMGNRHFLVVDDSTTFRQLLCMSLTRLEGIKESDITQATDGLDALEKVRSGKFDLVLTDIRMPRMDGLEFVRRVRGDLNRTDIPIIIISTKGAEEDIETGMRIGANGYLSKPISMLRLRELVSSLLPNKD